MKKTINGLLRLTRILFGLAILVGLSTSAQAATIIVTSDADSGAGTLRQAILDANASAGVGDMITFNIGGGGVRTINLLSPLPAITGTGTGFLTIDGYTQPGSSVNTAAVGSNAVLNIELNGAGAGSAIGLRCSGIGGDSFCTITGLVINRFQEGGIRIDATALGFIRGSFIGTNAAGTAALGNFNYGILVLNQFGTSIGNATPTFRNVISGNSGTGITISDTASSVAVLDNLIGTAVNGTTDLGNTSHGILIANSDLNTIDDNVISGNNGSGVAIQTDFGFTASNNNVTGNFIGVNANGNTALRNNGSGVLVQASGNFIGDGTTANRNVISGNGTNGISISTNFATGNFVRGNYIGVGNNGTTSIPNNDNGIQIANSAAGNTIGGTSGTTLGLTPACTGQCNIIANNGVSTSVSARAGIYLDTTAGAGNAIRANSIFANGEIGLPNGLGIDLGATGATANDAGDADTGANNLQNKPVITGANDLEFISGTLNSTPSTVFAIDFFVNSAPLTSEGRTYIGTVSTTTNGAGNAAFNFTTTVPLSVGQFITATATATGSALAPQSVGDSSEHSDAVAVIVQPTAATAALGGIINDAKGNPVRGASVQLLDSADGTIVQTFTNAKGFFVFNETVVGRTYVITPQAKGYTFNPQSLLISHLEAQTNINFTAIQTRRGR